MFGPWASSTVQVPPETPSTPVSVPTSRSMSGFVQTSHFMEHLPLPFQQHQGQAQLREHKNVQQVQALDFIDATCVANAGQETLLRRDQHYPCNFQGFHQMQNQLLHQHPFYLNRNNTIPYNEQGLNVPFPVITSHQNISTTNSFANVSLNELTQEIVNTSVRNSVFPNLYYQYLLETTQQHLPNLARPSDQISQECCFERTSEKISLNYSKPKHDIFSTSSQHQSTLMKQDLHSDPSSLSYLSKSKETETNDLLSDQHLQSKLPNDIQTLYNQIQLGQIEFEFCKEAFEKLLREELAQLEEVPTLEQAKNILCPWKNCCCGKYCTCFSSCTWYVIK